MILTTTILGVKKYFYCLKAYKKFLKKIWSTTLDFVDLESKSALLLY
jgi:hypothetical protein